MGDLKCMGDLQSMADIQSMGDLQSMGIVLDCFFKKTECFRTNPRQKCTFNMHVTYNIDSMYDLICCEFIK